MKRLLMMIGAMALLSMTAKAGNGDWYGATDNKWSTASNWNGSDIPNKKLNANFQGDNFAQRFKDDGRVVLFDGQYINKWKVHVKKIESSAPVVFRATSAENGLTAGATSADNKNDTGYLIGYDIGDGWLKVESGTYMTSADDGAWYVGSQDYAGHITVCEGATIVSANDFDFRNGTVDVGGALTAKIVKIGNLKDKTATMTVSGGTVTNTSGATYIGYVSGATGALYLNEGGTLVTRNVFKQKTDATGTLVFNGGTLKSREVYSDYGGLIGTTVAAKVGENGGTIDTGKLNITLGTPILDVDGEAGGMTVKGGGSLTVSVAQRYTGGTTVEAGTVLKMTTAAKEALVKYPVVVSVPDGGVANNTVVLQIMDGGTFTQEEVNAMTLSGVAGPCYTLVLANGNQRVALQEKPGASGDGYWIGGTDNNWAAASNWQNGIIPTAAKRNAYFSESNFSQRFKDGGCVVLFDGKRVNTWKVHVRAAGSENSPVVFRATSAENGLTAGTLGSDTSSGYLVGYDEGNGWLKIETGTYKTSNKGLWTVGGSYEGHITVCEGATIVSANEFDFGNGTVDVDGALTAKSIRIGTLSGKTATMTISGGTVTNTSLATYIGYESGAAGALYLNEGGTLVTRNVYTDAGAGTLVFNGGTLKANISYYVAQYGGVIGNTNILSVVVEANGGTIDNGGFVIYLTKTMSGVGGIQLAGSGTTAITANQSYTGTTTVKSGTTISATGVTFAGAVAFEAGSAVVVPEIPEGKSSVNILTAPTITGVENLPGPDENGNKFFLKGSNCLAWGRQGGLIISFH